MYIEIPNNRSFDIRRDVSFPFNLVADVFFLRTQEKIESISDKTAAGSLIALSLLTEDEKALMTMWYERRMSNTAISKALGVTTARATLIREKSLRKLRHPSRSKYMGDGFLADETDREKYKRQGYNDGYEDGVKVGLNAGLSLCLTEEESTARKQLTAAEMIERACLLRLEELDLNVRSYNCLRRAGCWTIADVLALTREQILTIRGLGVGSISVVADTLCRFGLSKGTAWEALRLEFEAEGATKVKARCSKSC